MFYKMRLRLFSNENKYIDIDSNLMTCSKLIVTIIHGLELEYMDIPLPIVNFKMLNILEQFVKLYAQYPLLRIPQPLPHDLLLSDIINEIYVFFIEQYDLDTLYNIIKVADYMDIKALLDLACARIAYILRSKNNVEEIKQILGI